MKLALGTVQFGIDYGIANTGGQVTEATAKQIIEKAREHGVDTLDTAIGYGDSEKCLGNIGVGGWRVITKLPKIPEGCVKITEWVNDQHLNSLKRLNIKHCTGLMLHSPMQLLEAYGCELWDALQTLKSNQFVKKIGYSVYSPSELELLWDDFQPDIIQTPYNIFDQRLKKSGWLSKLYENNVEIHIRSVFLQGLLLMKSNERPSKFDQWGNLWKNWDAWLGKKAITSLDACLGYVSSEEMIDFIVIGVDTVNQLQDIFESYYKGNKIIVPEELLVNDEILINPANWSKL
jgi:aryl-alcohol dehydrogenase-like predicted oxidoreductase